MYLLEIYEKQKIQAGNCSFFIPTSVKEQTHKKRDFIFQFSRIFQEVKKKTFSTSEICGKKEK
jgi:hypothetical protein